MTGQDLLGDLDSLAVLQYLSERGSVDGVTRDNTLTEDGLPAQDGIDLITRLREVVRLGKLNAQKEKSEH